MRRRLPSRTLGLLLLGAFALSECNKGPLVLVTVNKLPAGTASLQAVIMREGGADAQLERSSFPVGEGAQKFSFGVRFPDGAQGSLRLGVAALSSRGCVIGLSNPASEELKLSGDLGQPIVDLTAVQSPALNCVPGAPTITEILQQGAPGQLILKGWGFTEGTQVRIAALPLDQGSPSLEALPCVPPTPAQARCMQPAPATGAVQGQPVLGRLRLSPTQLQITDDSLRAPTGKLGVCVVAQNPDQAEGCLATQQLSLTFQSTQLQLGRLHPDSIALSDLNGDGRPDLAIAAQEEPEVLGGAGVGLVAIYFNQGGGAFSQAPLILRMPERGIARSLATGYVNQDKLPDLLVGHIETNEITILLNQGGAAPFSLDKSINIKGLFKPDSLVVSDLNGDGRNDVALVNDAFTGTSPMTGISILPQDAQGSFPTGRRYFVGIGPGFLLAEPLAPGQRPALIVSGLRVFFDANNMVDADRTGGGVLVLPNDGMAGFPVYPADLSGVAMITRDQYKTSGAFGGIGLADLDKRNGPDLVAAGAAKGSFRQDPGNSVTVLLNQGDGKFAAGGEYPSGRSPFGVALGDLNGDTWTDIAVTNIANSEAGTITVLLNQKDGVFPKGNVPTYAAGFGSGAPAAGDLNGDGKIDMAVANFGIIDSQDPKKSIPGSLTIYLNTSR